MYRVAVGVVALMLVVAACDESDPRSDSAATTKPASPPGDAQQEDAMDEDGPVAQAIDDLAAQTGANPDDIEVVVHEEVTWRDGSLGCPEPGMHYTQALVEGYRIVLRADGEELAYHGQRGKPPFRCNRPDPDGAVNMGPNR